MARTMAVCGADPEPSPRFQRDAGKQRAGGVSGQQHAVGHAGVAVPEVVGEARHLGVVGVADHEGSQPGEQGHRGQDPDACRWRGWSARCRQGRGRRGVAALRPGAGGRPEQPEQHRQVEQRVENDAVGRAQRQHDDAAHGRTDQDAQIARHRVHPHRARQIGRADDVVEQQLVRRLPQHAGAAVDDQKQHRVPHLQRVGDEEDAPSRRRHDEQQHPALDDAARVEPVRQPADGDGKQQKGKPVRQHREAGQRG